MASTNLPPRAENPYFILGLKGPATPLQIERQKQKCLALIEAKGGTPLKSTSPLGKVAASADDVRRAAARLQDPFQRLWCAFWAEVFREVPPRPDELYVLAEKETAEKKNVFNEEGGEDNFDPRRSLSWWQP
ncbi:MAG: hypothetical protein GY822_21125 [Deltaproteobacteria bacterium]|nr:hypothetical protein [Deltaproteobacteria bacterium]